MVSCTIQPLLLLIVAHFGRLLVGDKNVYDFWFFMTTLPAVCGWGCAVRRANFYIFVNTQYMDLVFLFNFVPLIAFEIRCRSLFCEV